MSPEDAIVNRMALAEALRALSPKHREVLDLAFFQGFGPEEIAHILDVPAGTVKSRISYARRALQAQLAEGTKTGEMGL
jgi:RNA polymerase sigma-70 factor (ECF subfamily)